jgi:hypothetical protein
MGCSLVVKAVFAKKPVGQEALKRERDRPRPTWFPTGLDEDLAAVGIRPPWPAFGDVAGWDQVRRAVLALPKQPEGRPSPRDLWRRIKAARHAAWFEPKDWRDCLAPDAREWAIERMSAKVRENGDPCVNNLCVVDAHRSSGTRRFAKNRDEGCCGRAEWTEVGPDGRTYKFAFNFGH